jgi:hypothetical protein
MIDIIGENGNNFSANNVSVEKKVQGGKYLKVTLDITNNVITGCSITGDFFVFPETFIEQVEKSIINKKAEAELIREELLVFIETKGNEVEFVGVEFEDIEQMVLECVAKSKSN